MATTTAKITITSTDLIDSQALNLAASCTLTDEGVTTGTVNTSGLGRKKCANTSPFTLFDGADYGAGSHKLYIRNLETDAAKYFEIKINNEVVGHIYAGDWVFLPWRAATDTSDIIITSGSANQSLEYMLFYE